jgi:hypothetical protein
VPLRRTLLQPDASPGKNVNRGIVELWHNFIAKITLLPELWHNFIAKIKLLTKKRALWNNII